jgi:hypothetical protein
MRISEHDLRECRIKVTHYLGQPEDAPLALALHAGQPDEVYRWAVPELFRQLAEKFGPQFDNHGRSARAYGALTGLRAGLVEQGYLK